MSSTIARAGSRALAFALVAVSPPTFAQVDTPEVVSLEVGLETPPDTVSGVCKASGDPSTALKTNRVIVEGRWANADLPLKAGDPLTAEKASAALNTLREAISQSSASYFDSAGEVHVLRIMSDCEEQPDGSMNFILQPRYVGLSLVRVGDNVLPIPRWREPAPFETVPPFVRTLMPAFGAAYDDETGTAFAAAIGPRLMHKVPSESSPYERSLTAQLSAEHSLDQSAYADSAKLAYSWQQMKGLLRGATLSVGYARMREPIDDREHDNEIGDVAGGVTLKLRPNTRLYADLGYGTRDDELSATAIAPATATSDRETSMRVMFETIPSSALGFARASLWATDADGYEQYVARAGYAKEISLRPNQNLGLEVVLGAGRAHGEVPDYALFRGGSVQQKFLYDAASTPKMLDLPRGPMLRSFGMNAAGLPDGGSAAIGGTRFWQLNVDFALPIPRWSRPLIPDVTTELETVEGEPLTLKQVMQNQVNSGANFLQPVLVNRGLSPDEAKRQADEVFAEVGPAARYVINDANIYSIKPLLLLDVAGLSDSANSETWVSLGAGVQVTLVTAKLEVGYARTVHGPTFGSRSAPFARLVFQRLF